MSERDRGAEKTQHERRRHVHAWIPESEFRRLKPEVIEGWGLMTPTIDEEYDGGTEQIPLIKKTIRDELIKRAELLDQLNDVVMEVSPAAYAERALTEVTFLIEELQYQRRLMTEAVLNDRLLTVARTAKAIDMTDRGVAKWRNDPMVSVVWE